MRSLQIPAAAAVSAFVIVGSAVSHGPGDPNSKIDLVVNRPVGAVSPEMGLDAWSRIYAVVSSPRCSNCHVDDRGVPMWSGPSFGETRPHGMNINAGPSRIGAETLPCSTCHMQSAQPNETPHAPPHAGLPWMLAPSEFAWFDRTSAEICAQMKNPATNGGRNGEALVEHILHDAQMKAFITWGFDPGGGREKAPGTMQGHLDDMVMWTTAGMPCPE